MTWNCKRENYWRAHRTLRGTLLKAFFYINWNNQNSRTGSGWGIFIEKKISFLVRKKSESILVGSHLKHVKANSKYFLDKDFVTICITTFLNAPKKVKSLKSLTSPGACSPISHSAQLPTALPRVLEFYTALTISSLILTDPYAGTLCFHSVLEPTQTHSWSTRAEMREEQRGPL